MTVVGAGSNFSELILSSDDDITYNGRTISLVKPIRAKGYTVVNFHFIPVGSLKTYVGEDGLLAAQAQANQTGSVVLKNSKDGYTAQILVMTGGIGSSLNETAIFRKLRAKNAKTLIAKTFADIIG